jgi:hypothetical protein
MAVSVSAGRSYAPPVPDVEKNNHEHKPEQSTLFVGENIAVSGSKR